MIAVSNKQGVALSNQCNLNVEKYDISPALVVGEKSRNNESIETEDEKYLGKYKCNFPPFY